MSSGEPKTNAHLSRTLGPLMLWGLGVGYVISGMYFGWNLGLAEGGTYGLGLATIFIIILYITFTFSYTELACAIPKAGGVFDYATRALGKDAGFIAGMAQIIEFVFAPPAIAAAIGAYFHIFFPQVPVTVIAIVAYIIFTSLNIYGVKAAATFELVITILAVVELLIFAGATLPHFEWKNVTENAFPNGIKGAWAAIPFAIWFFLAIEGVANVAEEAVNPQRNILIGFGSALLTLIILCILTFLSSVGVAGWEAIVYPSPGAEPSDSPLPLALAKITGNSGWLYHLLITIGLMGLVASFHGIILAAGRATFEFGRVGYIPLAIGKVHRKFKTPANALLINMVVGIIALLTGKTSEIITIACFGALTLYIFSMITVLVLRKKEPDIERPFKVPFFPYFPYIALIIAIISLIAMTTLNLTVAMIYFGILLAGYIWFHFFVKK
ncbi:MAG: ethanolamine permease [Terrimonas sp.]|uniref:ethanolamine permease n=1 Tax=Terrimonas sp. TaxID=1914338 RepID=UPI000ACF2D15|nr:ethanolamine permease [Terrimonas sp.]MBN8785831.1 ethanolamine permease [Terrimonas sp.]PVD52611.1 ethanolamine permease [Terrimonas sp.]